ncbi:MAG TPA: DegV family protein [Ruminococcaceae bacterium]|nr:DegV family protein [Oscillospiraceae bacterium]
MSTKIRFITDTASDLLDEQVKEYGIDMLHIPIAVDGKGYYERIDFTIHEFYKILNSAAEIPTTSQVLPITYADAYKRAYNDGCTDVICVTITSQGSNMFNNAVLAVDMFFEENPDAKGKINFYIVDSGTYTYCYGYAIVKACQMAREGKTVGEIIGFLNFHFDHLEVYFSVFSLEHAKKSGRINCAAAFVGEMLGLRPIIQIIDGKMAIIEKVRGDKAVPAHMAKVFEEKTTDKSYPYLILLGEDAQPGYELARLIEKNTGKKAYGCFNAGAAISINAGPRLVGLMIHGQKRSGTRKFYSNTVNSLP